MTALAVKVMGLFARPEVGADTWWAELSPYLSDQAREDYSYTDPANVPVSKITGSATLVDLDTDRLAIVHIPTNDGLYAVTLSRSPADPEWVVERITPPEPHAV